MATHGLLMEVRLLTDRYHGTRDWPPSPFRVFQALVAGAYGGRWATEPRAGKDAAFEWLERLEPPLTAAPAKLTGRETTYYVPNNDLDAKGGDPRQAANIRVAKEVVPALIPRDATLLYAWPFDGETEHAETICRLAERLHTLGRGVDAASARAEIVPWQEAEARLRSHPGIVGTPAATAGLPSDPTCPTSGSLASLAARYQADTSRFSASGRDTLFRQPPKPEFRTVAYDQPSERLLFELHGPKGEFRPAAPIAVARLASLAREKMRERLKRTLPDREKEIAVALDGSAGPERNLAIRILPLSTIGHRHATSAIRRVLIEVPPGCPVARGDIAWAATGLVLEDAECGVSDARLVPVDDFRMLRHYGFGVESRRWRTVTPVALELERRKGRLRGSDRANLLAVVARKIAEDARLAGLPTGGLIVHPQREPLHERGRRADHFQPGSSTPRALFHAELIFQQPIRGPLVLGAGARDGLGIFRPSDPPERRSTKHVSQADFDESRAPASSDRAMLARFVVRSGPSLALAVRIAEVARQALMAKLGNRCPPEISGRDEAGPLRGTGEHRHAFFLPEDADGDGFIDHLSIFCSSGFGRDTVRAMDALSKLWIAPRGEIDEGAGEWDVALEVLSRPEDMRASRLVGFSREWTSVTPYLKPRYDRKPPRSFAERVRSYEAQIAREWVKSHPGTPLPTIQAITAGERFRVPGGKLEPDAFVRTRDGRGGHQPDAVGGFFKLTFPRPVAGPIALGKHAHFGMGLFERTGLR